MVSFSEGRHAAEFLLSEASGNRSRENGTVASGQNLAAGEVVMLSGGNIVAYGTGTDDVPVGIMLAAVDATSAAQPGAYIARDAEVNGKLLTYPTPDIAGVVADLKTLGIIIRT